MNEVHIGLDKSKIELGVGLCEVNHDHVEEGLSILECSTEKYAIYWNKVAWVWDISPNYQKHTYLGVLVTDLEEHHTLANCEEVLKADEEAPEHCLSSDDDGDEVLDGPAVRRGLKVGTHHHIHKDGEGGDHLECRVGDHHLGHVLQEDALVVWVPFLEQVGLGADGYEYGDPADRESWLRSNTEGRDQLEANVVTVEYWVRSEDKIVRYASKAHSPVEY